MLDYPVRKIMRRQKLLTAKPEAFVAKVAQRMAARNVGAILVIEGERLVGIFTERDLLVRVIAAGLEPRTTRLAEVMTPAPATITADRPLGYALVVMYRGGFRHLPVTEDGKPVGIVSARSALDPDLEEFTSETSRRKHFDDMVAGKA